VSDQALVDAVHVCALFNIIVRLADALAWEVPPAEAFAARAPVLREYGYALRTVDEVCATQDPQALPVAGCSTRWPPAS
jgi:hypothetical protein